MKHTPGPWRAGGNHVFARTWSGHDNWIASTDSPFVSHDEPIGNASLIAAAPDMLAALRIALHDYTLNDSAARVVEAAIAKAEGTLT